MFSTSPELQIEVDALSGVLTALPIGGVASYAELSERVGYDVQKRPFALFKARAAAEEATGLRFATVRATGVKKLEASEVVGIGSVARARIARTAKRQCARLAGVRYNDIDAATQARIDAERSVLGALSALAKGGAEKVAEGTQTGPVVAARVFEMMK